MSYRDPYAAQYGNNQYQNYGQGYEFNPYSSQQQQYPTYGQSGAYTDNYNGGYRDEPSQYAGQQSQSNTRTKDMDETSGFDRGEFPVKDETPRLSRRDYQVNLWTQGGRGRCFGRFCCCTLMIALFLFISIVLALALWIRPPSVTIGNAQVRGGTTGADTSQLSNLSIPLQVNISVNNPNYFSVELKKLEAEFTYPQGNIPLGSGRLDNVNLASGRETNFTFPFQIEYKLSDDPNLRALLDIGNKCGITSDQKSNLDVQYKITVGLQIIAATVNPSISNTISFPCPFDQDTIDVGVSRT
ncbi:epressed protein [Moniliophthora roreri MCA 2997]|uniref:Epressed protein n=1 Tax=Moniliophthora roreri (strain MCA 2997) TaxID=1381753 RepID=V2XPQ2_MONRO|nr:epressed protein [Moniliophthora roreri MCA 2997]KAI3610816.1 epressed protein [Moniliophthora roreri]